MKGNHKESIKKNTLELFEQFMAASPDAKERLNQMFNKRFFHEGETIYIQGASPSAIYIMAKGRVKIARVTKGGNETILCIRGDGDIFCPVPILDGGDQFGAALAITDVELIWAERQDFLRLCQDFPEIMAYVQGDCLFEVRHLLNRMESLAFSSVRERLAFTLLEELDRHAAHGGPENELYLKHQDLAGLVSASRESVSRTLSLFEDQKILKIYRKRLIILNIQKLKIIAGEET